jgi:hypothetical protein
MADKEDFYYDPKTENFFFKYNIQRWAKGSIKSVFTPAEIEWIKRNAPPPPAPIKRRRYG